MQLWLSGGLFDRSSLRSRVNRLLDIFRDMFVRSGGRSAGVQGEGRIEGMMKQLHYGVALPALALPTHAGGWIDGRVLVERWKQYEVWKISPNVEEVTLALGRLMPDFRHEALEAAETLAGEWAPALRWALGGKYESISDGGSEAERVWLAAAVARFPRRHFTGVDALQAYLGGDMVVPDTVYTWSAPEAAGKQVNARERNRRRWGPRPEACSRLLLDVAPPGAFRLDVWFPRNLQRFPKALWNFSQALWNLLGAGYFGDGRI